MTLPEPQIGLVIPYAYLWADERRAGLEEGKKTRPCVLVAATRVVEGRTIVTVFPITHSPPKIASDAVELPAVLKRYLGLDDERSWVIVTEFNRFVWPGVDLRPVPWVTPTRYAYGFVPAKFMRSVIEEFGRARKARRVEGVVRTE